MLSRKCLLCLVIIPLFFVSCAGSSRYMRTSETLLGPTNDMALVRFMRERCESRRLNYERASSNSDSAATVP